MWQASAPGKIILFGEHAVVYGRPAIAAPIHGVQATVRATPGRPGQGIVLALPDVGQQLTLSPGAVEQPLAHVAQLALAAFGLAPTADLTLTLHSDIPFAGGLGSGAAAATAIVRAVAAAAGAAPVSAQVSALVYESEKYFHGTPSGIDNTVIAYEMPVWFVRGHAPQPFAIARPFSLLIADTGVASPTSVSVADVRRAWQAEPARLEALFDAAARLAHAARAAIAQGQLAALGPLMDENQACLQAMEVSSPQLDALCLAARRAGATGAKLSGGGRGGNMIALVEPEVAARVGAALQAAGAVRVLHTLVA